MFSNTRRIYFDLETGNKLVEVGYYGYVSVSDVESDIKKHTELLNREVDSFSYLEIPFTDYAQDFAESNGYRVNPDTKELEFSYPDPNEPEAPPVFQKALSEQIKTLELQQHQTNEDLSALMDFVISGGM